MVRCQVQTGEVWLMVRNLRIIIPEVVFEDRADILYRKLSISVPRKSENLVGNVMSGMKP